MSVYVANTKLYVTSTGAIGISGSPLAFNTGDVVPDGTVTRDGLVAAGLVTSVAGTSPVSVYPVTLVQDPAGALSDGIIPEWDTTTSKWIPGTALSSTAANATYPTLVSAAGYGIVGNGTTDDTTALQAAADAIPSTGGILYIPPLTYKTSAPITLKSKTTVWMWGAKFTPVAVGSFTSFSGTYVSTGNYALFRNVNYDAASITDTDIHIHGGRLVPTSAWNGHGVYLRAVRGVRIHDLYGDDLADVTALLHCDDTLVQGCKAKDASNAGFDHWDSPTNATVRDCDVDGAQWGVLVTGCTTTNTTGAAENITVDNVRVRNFTEAAVLGNCASAASTVNNLKIVNCTADGTGVTPLTVFSAQGGVTNFLIADNTARNITAAINPFQCQAEGGGGTPSKGTFRDNLLADSNLTAAAIVQAYGMNHSVKGTKATNSTYGAMVATNSTTTASDEWLAYTPTITSADSLAALGNGTIAGRYCVVGRTVHFSITFTRGSTTTFGASQLRLSLPVTSNGYYAVLDGITNGTNIYLLGGSIIDGNTIAPRTTTPSWVTNTAPMAWTTSDTLILRGTYEATAAAFA